MRNIELKNAQESTICIIESLERHGFLKICEHIDKGEYEQANKVADVLERVGII